MEDYMFNDNTNDGLPDYLCRYRNKISFLHIRGRVLNSAKYSPEISDSRSVTINNNIYEKSQIF